AAGTQALEAGIQAMPENQQAMPGAESIEGESIDQEWSRFTPESGTIDIPRSDMPQIKAEHRGAMVNFMNARDISHAEETVPAASLKPTQAEFSKVKVAKAKEFEGGDRAILVSSDNHVLDGHHQWLAKREAGEDVRIIRLNAPIRDLVKTAHEFPSSTVDGGQQITNEPLNDKSIIVKGLTKDDAGRFTGMKKPVWNAKQNGFVTLKTNE